MSYNAPHGKSENVRHFIFPLCISIVALSFWELVRWHLQYLFPKCLLPFAFLLLIVWLYLSNLKLKNNKSEKVIPIFSISLQHQIK